MKQVVVLGPALVDAEAGAPPCRGCWFVTGPWRTLKKGHPCPRDNGTLICNADGKGIGNRSVWVETAKKEGERCRNLRTGRSCASPASPTG